MSLKVQNITKYFGELKALDQVSFSCAKGQIIGFLGPNGAGKSTTMKIICGSLTPSSGAVYINDQQLTITNKLTLQNQIGYLPENNPLYPDLYVKEYLYFVAQAYKLNKKESSSIINRWVEEIQLADQLHKKLGELSKGYKQRVGLVAALVGNPDILILDEPTAGLDPNQLIIFRSMLKSLAAEKTILFSSHVLSEIEAICNRCIIINKGKIIADDSLATLKSKEQKSKVHIMYEMTEAFPLESFRKHLGKIEVQLKDTDTIVVCSKLTNELHQKIADFFKQNQIELLGIQKITKAIDEIFSSLTNN